MRAPEPGGRWVPLQHPAHCSQIDRFTPGKLERIKIKPKPPRMAEQALSKFPVAKHQTASRLQGELTADDVIGQCARAKKQLDLACPDHFAKNLFCGLKILRKNFRAMRLRGLFEGAPNFTPHRHRPGQKINGARLKGT